MIRNIVFDMGQVLIEFNPEKFIRHLGYTNKEEIDYINNHIFLTSTWKDMDAGIIDADEGHKYLVDNIDEKYKRDAEILVNSWWKFFDPIEGMLELVKVLDNKGYHLYLLSNASNDQPYYWSKLPYKNYFEGTYISSLHKKMKPNKNIYEDFIKQFKLDKNECVFIDDTLVNVDAGNNFGIKSHQFVGTDELINYFKELNII